MVAKVLKGEGEGPAPAFAGQPRRQQPMRPWRGVGSGSLHQRPDLARRMVRAADYRPGEWVLLKPFFAGYELLKIAKAKRTLDTDRGRQARSRCPLTRDGGGPGGHEIQ